MTIRLRCEYSQYRYWGVPTRYIDLVRYLDDARYKPVLHGTSDIEAESQLPAWLTPLRGWLNGLIGHGGMPWYRVGDLGAEVEAMQSCTAQQTDIIHFMDGEHCGQFLPRRIREMGMAGVKTVATFHQPPDIARGLVNEEMLRWLDAIILVSPSQLPFFKQRVSEDKLHVVLLGVDAEVFTPAAEKNDSDRVVCITTGLNLRDWETFKKVAQRTPDITFVVVTSSRLKFEDMPNVVQHSGITDADLAGLYRSADILFLPLLDTTANNTLLEGIASGLPVVATDHEAVRAYLPNDEGILIAGNRVEAFVDALRRLQRDPTLRRTMGQAARVRAEELSWPNIIKEYDAIYTRLHESPVADGSPAADGATAAAKAPLHNRNRNLQERFRAQSILPPNSALQDVDILGYALLETGLTEEAIWLFAGLSNSAPEEILGDAGLARIAERHWKWNDAIAAIDKCLLLAPDDIRPRLISIKANYLAQTGDTQRANELLLTIQKEFDGLLALARLSSLESPEKAHVYWKACVAQFPEQPDGFLGQAAEFIAGGNYTEADNVLGHAMGVWPNLLAAKVLWARCATNAKNVPAARARWKVVLAGSGRDDDLPAAYARFLGLTRDRARAENYCRSSELSPAAAADFFLEYHSASGDLAAAIAQARELSSLQQDDMASRLRETALYLRQGAAEGLRTAEAILRDALAKAPDSAIVKAELAELLIRLGLDQEAKEIVQKINFADRRIQFEILRLWATLSDGNDSDGVEYWKGAFLGLGALATTKNFSTDMKLTDRQGFY